MPSHRRWSLSSSSSCSVSWKIIVIESLRKRDCLSRVFLLCCELNNLLINLTLIRRFPLRMQMRWKHLFAFLQQSKKATSYTNKIVDMLPTLSSITKERKLSSENVYSFVRRLITAHSLANADSDSKQNTDFYLDLWGYFLSSLCVKSVMPQAFYLGIFFQGESAIVHLYCKGPF